MKTKVQETAKTARFSEIVEAAGRPDVHVLLTTPENDKVLQTAIKEQRVMTIEQARTRGKADRGTIGFDPGQSRQFLIFPKSIGRFAGSAVVAIKYDLLEPGDSQVPSRPAVKEKVAKSKAEARGDTKSQAPPTAKIIPFTNSAPPPPEEPVEPIQALRNELQNAIGLLTQGKEGAALKLLRRIVKDLRPPQLEAAKPESQRP